MIRKTKDGRTIRTGKHYSKFRYDVWEDAVYSCELCGALIGLDEMHLHHVGGRGLGGSKRDDIRDKCISTCPPCHRKEHNQ